MTELPRVPMPRKKPATTEKAAKPAAKAAKTATPKKPAAPGKTATRKPVAAPGADGHAAPDGKFDLIVVESPTKAKTINKYLGSGYHVLASYGHVRDLPTRKEKGEEVAGVRISDGWKLRYVVEDGDDGPRGP